MNWNDVANTVSKVAPALGAAVGGPGGFAIGSGIAKLLGVEDNPEAVQAALFGDPEATQKIRALEADMERALITQRGEVVKAEAEGESWLQRNWRPLVMIWFSILVGGYWFGWTPENLTEDAVLALFEIVQFGLSGYIVGRSAEKIAKTVSGNGLMDNILTKRK